jgi:hypothetical protein
MLWFVLGTAAVAAATVATHVAGLAALLGAMMRASAPVPTRLWPMAWLLIRLSWALILLHMVEIGLWAVFLHLCAILPDFVTALYFSATSYTTLGYGDVVLPQPWRLLGPIEALVGILMGGLSIGVVFAVLSRILTRKYGAPTR